MNRNLRWLALLAVVTTFAIALYRWLPQRDRPAQAPPTPEIATEDTGLPAVRHPIEAVRSDAGEPPVDAASQPLPTLADSDPAVEAALQGLLGQQAVLRFLNIGPHIRHLVATVDNLPRKKASTRAWPVKQTAGRFAVEESDGAAAHIAAENFARYTPFVDLVTSIDTGRAVALYVRFYPLLQQAYEDLGYPGRHFNDRVIEVIDHLLATPEPDGPIAVVLPPHDTSIDVERPWTMYEFADSRLESASAGQKILLRIGPENESRLKKKLTELRLRLASKPPVSS